MINSVIKCVKKTLSSPAVRKCGKEVCKHVAKNGHKFAKHPMKHADKAVKAAFKVGVETGKKFKL